ncbi:uncharacterized protein LOC116247809 isoform X2 [Nymphaea colorata]|uniref:uncharacterized protein LOC116247809 isoform X2 n=1 Tax=Nymphaea colorata TaxID=210225 RepID=UPI00129D7208|nr:uncharacterized protein LOC116247809 isoform X2 [Nymphaea colorata]
MANNATKEPSTAPQPDKWYDLTLGSSFTEAASSSKFCTLRYEFKPASIDKSQPGSLIKTKDNKVTVEFQNNQPGKPKVIFEGTSEAKDNEAVLLFDGNSFRLERLHRAVKRLRHLRLPGESSSAAAAAAASAASASDPLLRSPPHAKPSAAKPLSVPPSSVTKTALHSVVPVEVERIDIGEFGSSVPILPTSSPIGKSDESEKIDVLMDDDEAEAGLGEAPKMNLNMRNIENDSEDEIADVDITDEEADKGPNAAEALRAQVNAQARNGQTSSSSGSSGSGSSGSGSGSASGSGSGSSSDSEASDDDSVNSV